ncbi:nuclear transport factor 2 family protein [Streptomyces ficellus]|uniref:Nuclear transport factor 2 family protein n=1 Tax=Streptomyces ficellus TaxID=1977088 RepID=A0ABT7ZAR3_9ACTN|nr:nuclear transport factor 2 family protein [Streptomyces ficellus]MDN3296528.1 nuclear transport factor 2 family protein [Streptomyces ficellus]
MTQRVNLATVMDRLAIDELITRYAVAVDDADWPGYRELFMADAHADYRDAGGIAGTVAEVADWLAETMRAFPVRQHLIVNRRVSIEDLGGYPGDSAEVFADYVNPMRGDTGEDFVSGGRYAFALSRADGGWRLRTVVVHEKWRRVTGPLSAE